MLNDWIIIQPITEVGEDFIARPYEIYGNSLNSYFDPEEAFPFKELSGKFEIFRRDLLIAMAKQIKSANELIVQAILRRTLIEPNGFTYFDLKESRFEIKEFVVTLDELSMFISDEE